MPQTWCHCTSGEIIIVPGNAEWCRETGVRQMWGLVRNFICHCTLQQTSLLIRSPWTRLGIWTVCSWTDRMVSFCAPVNTGTHIHTHSHFTSISNLLKWYYTKGMQIAVTGRLLELSLHLVAVWTRMRKAWGLSNRSHWELFAPHSVPQKIRLFNNGVHQSPQCSINSLLCLTIHLLTAHLSKHAIDSIVYSLYVLSGLTGHNIKKSVEHWGAQRTLSWGCLSDSQLFRYGENTHKTYIILSSIRYKWPVLLKGVF